MLIKLYKVIAMAALVTLLLAQAVIVAVAATAQPSTNAASARAPLTDAVRIEQGMVQWYKFKYKYDNSQSDNQPSAATVLLKMDAAGCVGFAMETPGTLATPAGEKHNPIGIGSPLTKKLPNFDPLNNAKNLGNADDTNGNGTIDDAENPYKKEDHGAVKNEQVLIWAGGGRATETFYVVVKNQSKAACAYKLAISGPTVSFPANPAVAPTPTATTKPIVKSKPIH